MPFVKGDPRINRKGRPEGKKNYETLRKEAIRELAIRQTKELGRKVTSEEIELMIHLKGVSEAIKGNFQFYKDDMDRIYGQATQKHEIEGGMKLEIDVERKAKIKKLLENG